MPEVCLGLRRLPKMATWPGVIGAGGKPEGGLLARLVKARGVSGLHRLPEMSIWPGVTGARGSPKAVCWRIPEVCLGLGGYRKVSPLPNVTAMPREPEGRLLRGWRRPEGLSGVRWCRKCRHGRKIEVGREAEGGLSAPYWRGCRSPGFVGTSRAAGSPVLAEVVCRWGRRRLRAGWGSWRGSCGKMPLVEASYRSVGPGLRQLCKGPGHRAIRPPVQRNPFPEGR